MEKNISSRERTLAAINHKEADRVPIFFRNIAPLNHLWNNTYERIDVLLKMGVDEKVNIGIGAQFHPDVTVRDWFDDESDPEYSLACREYNTPEGTLRTIVRRTEDSRYENGIPLASDHSVSRAVEFLVKGSEDLTKLAYLLQEPNKEDIARFRQNVQRVKKYAAEKSILVEGNGGPGGSLIFHLCGESMYYIDADEPGFLEEFTEMIYKLDLKCMEIILDEGVDIISTNGCYETAPIWSPNFYDKLFAPWLEKKANLAHQAGVKLTYFSTGDFVPHTETLLRVGIDIINAIRPFYGGVNDMRLLKERIGQRICLWGGINPEEVIENGTPDEVRGSVIDIILAAASGGGLVLSTGGSIFFNKGCYDNVITLIEAVHEFGRYPIDVAQLEVELERYPYINLS